MHLLWLCGAGAPAPPASGTWSPGRWGASMLVATTAYAAPLVELNAIGEPAVVCEPGYMPIT
jgi:hypothetical protein